MSGRIQFEDDEFGFSEFDDKDTKHDQGTVTQPQLKLPIHQSTATQTAPSSIAKTSQFARTFHPKITQRDATVVPTAARNAEQLEVWVVGVDYKSGLVTVEHFPPENCCAMPSSGVPRRLQFQCSNDKLHQAKVGTRAFVVPHPNPSVGLQLRLQQSKRERERTGTIVRLIHKGMAIVNSNDEEPASLLWATLAKTEIERFLAHVGARNGNNMFLSGSENSILGVSVTFSLHAGTSVAKDATFDFTSKGNDLSHAEVPLQLKTSVPITTGSHSPAKIPSGDPNTSAPSTSNTISTLELGQGGTKLNRRGLVVGDNSQTIAGETASSTGSPTNNLTSQPRSLLPSLSVLLGSWEVEGELKSVVLKKPSSSSEAATGTNGESPPIIQCQYLKWTLDNHTPPLITQETKLSIALWRLMDRVIAAQSSGEGEGNAKVPPNLAAKLSVVDDDGEDVTETVCEMTVREASKITADEPSHTFELGILPFEMEGSCCEVRLKITIYSQVKVEAVDSTLVEFISRPFFVRPSMETKGKTSSKEKRRAASKGASLESSIVSPYSSDSSSSKFWTRDYLTPSDRLEPGFIDPGRANHLLDPDAANSLLKDSDPLYYSLREREVLLVDEQNDPTLQKYVADSINTLSHITDTRAKVHTLAWFVSSVMGGVNVTDAAFDASMATLRFGADTRRKPTPSHRSAGGGSKVKQSANTLKLGSIPIGLCRHRALLYKFLADKNHLLCYLVRGIYKEAATVEGGKPIESRHSWCIVLTGDPSAKGCGEMLLVDPTHPSPVQTWPQPGYSCPELPSHTSKIRVARAPATNDYSTSCFFSASTIDSIPIRQEDVGQGAVAIVHRASFGGLSCAVKVPRCEEDEEDLKREYAALLDFRESADTQTSSLASSSGKGDEGITSPGNGIVQCLGWCDGLLLEYVPFSLLGFMNSLLLRRMFLKSRQIKEVLIALTRALKLVHSKGYVHRDVKTENVLVFPERCTDCIRTGVVCPHCNVIAKLADFADCCRLPHGPGTLSDPAPVVGTAPYAAPELEAEAPFGAAADIWSLGILAAELFLMRLPLPFTSGISGKFVISPYATSGSTSSSTNSKSQEGKIFIPSLDAKATVPWGIAFVDGCLKVKWEERLSCDQLLEILMTDKGV